MRIVVAHPDRELRSLIRRRLELAPGAATVFEAHDLRELRRVAGVCRPDVLLVAARLPGARGRDAGALARAEAPEADVIVLHLGDEDGARVAAVVGAEVIALRRRGTSPGGPAPRVTRLGGGAASSGSGRA